MNDYIPLIDIPKNILLFCYLSRRGNHILKLKPEVSEWCKENGIQYKRIGSKSYYEGFSFYSSESALAFKLMWVDGSILVGIFGLNSKI